MSMIFLLIQIKFNIGKSDDELLETIWKLKKKKQRLIVTSSAQQPEAQICNCTSTL
jgi:precorrin-6B methylase 2